jgi:CRP-like cAMP-binding protein
MAADFLGGRVHHRQRRSHRGDSFGAATGRAERKEERLYRVAFSSIDKRDFLRLASLVRWVDCSPGEVILEKGEQIVDAIVLISGNVEAIQSSKARLAIRPGQLIGDVSAYSGLANPVNIVARDAVALAKWDLRHLREFTASRPDLRASLLRIVSADLAANYTMSSRRNRISPPRRCKARRSVSRVLSRPKLPWRRGWPFIWDVRRRTPRATDPSGGAKARPARLPVPAAPTWSCSRWGFPCRPYR